MKKILSQKRKKVIICIIFLILTYFLFTAIQINHYLNEYGYGIKELPKTVAVYFHLSKGFTVMQKENDTSVFIGRHDYNIYDKILAKRGYYRREKFGTSTIYMKNENQKKFKLYVEATNNWCHWFRIYNIRGAKIEDFI